MSREFKIKRGVIGARVPSEHLRGSSLNPQNPESSKSPLVKIKSEDILEQKFWQRYFYEKVLGRGGYGMVVLIKDRVSGRQAACKLVDKDKMSSEVLAALREEPKFLTRLSQSKHVIHLVEVLESKRRLFVVMEYMRGGDLQQYILQRGGIPFRESEVCLIVSSILKALKVIHGHNIVHGDIKPGRRY